MKDAAFIGGFALLLFAGLLSWLAKPVAPSIQIAKWEADLRRSLVRFIAGYQVLAGFLTTVARTLERFLGMALQLAIILVGGTTTLGVAMFFGYGAWRGVAMFLTLEPVAILAGFVLFAVSAFVGYWVVVAFALLTLWLWNKVEGEFASSRRSNAAKGESRPMIEAA